MNGKAAAIGTFDGVHLGHAAVLKLVRDIADEKGFEPIAITFDRHPLSLIAPQRAPAAITSIERKEKLIRRLGVTPVIVPFDETLRSTTAAEWMRLLRERYDVKALIVGYDNTFGSDGINYSISDYRSLGERLGIEVIEASVVDGVSSSAVRKNIEKGNVAEVKNMLGRPFSLSGIVVEGNKLGRTIGFPTANILPSPGIIIPGRGAYAARVILPDGKKVDAMVNIGVRPTIRRGNESTIEAHLINWKGDLYGDRIRIEFYSRLRDEEQFKSIDALRKQLKLDLENTLTVLQPRQK
ncbi:MAG: riboflavin biosynthesis protein RibF [Muribaculaceae bacterium]|nr:riboflavin biosynthesis protein RibF [Muribaculaceae bacterium]MDE6755281.1 riboflavin biosynthesis protein RibF [Muribaculaceae bacterium]